MTGIDLGSGGAAMFVVGLAWVVGGWLLSMNVALGIGAGLVSIGLIAIGVNPEGRE